jgi:hypothetical protein
MTATSQRAFAVAFRRLDLWSVGSYSTPSWNRPEVELKPLAAALRRRQDPVDKPAAGDDIMMISLSFAGEIEKRDVDVGAVEGRLFHARPGDVVYSKIDVRHGAIGVVPATVENAAVTAEFPVYVIDTTVALPEYVKLLFRTSCFREELASKVSGASGRKRINPDQLEATQVPLPEPGEQRWIVAEWRKSYDAVQSAHAAVLSVKQRLDGILESACDPAALAVLRARSLGALQSRLSRWDVPHPKAEFYRRSQPTLVFLHEMAVEATELVHPWEAPDHMWPVYGVSNQVGVFLSHRQRGADFNAAYKRIEPGWFFHNPTRSSVGSLGMVPSDAPADAITSPEYQVWRVLPDVDADFVAALLVTTFFGRLIRVHRSGGVKQRLYVQDLLQIGIPSLGAEVQAEIGAARRAALQQLARAQAKQKASELRIEELIVGTA